MPERKKKKGQKQSEILSTDAVDKQKNCAVVTNSAKCQQGNNGMSYIGHA
jgi:hypothetical protein